jgi:hypothetical protein
MAYIGVSFMSISLFFVTPYLNIQILLAQLHDPYSSSNAAMNKGTVVSAQPNLRHKNMLKSGQSHIRYAILVCNQRLSS